jgi:hypothetical protein
MRLLSRLATACVAAATMAALPSVALAKGASPFKIYTDHQQFIDAVGSTTKVDLSGQALGPASSATANGVTIAPSTGNQLNFFSSGGKTMVTAQSGDFVKLTMPVGGVAGVGFFYDQIANSGLVANIDATNLNGNRFSDFIFPGAFLDGLTASPGFIGIVPEPGMDCGSDYSCMSGSTIPAAPITDVSVTVASNIGIYDIEYAVTATPEPATVALMGIGLAGLAVGGVVRRRRRA